MPLGKRALRDRPRKKPTSSKSEAFKRQRKRRLAKARKELEKDILLEIREFRAKKQGDPKEVDPRMLELRRQSAKSKKPIRT